MARETTRLIVLTEPGQVAFPPDGTPQSTVGWDKQLRKLDEVIRFVEKEGGILASVEGWTPRNVERLLMHLDLFQDSLGGWIDYLKTEGGADAPAKK